MILEKRKQVEDTVSSILADLTKGEQAIPYKALYAVGLKIADCDEIIRKLLFDLRSDHHGDHWQHQRDLH